MIHPTRTNLLLLKEKRGSVSNSLRILKSRKQVLTREFLATTMPFLRSRDDLRQQYSNALDRLALSMGHEGGDLIESLTLAMQRDFRIRFIEKSIWGHKYREVDAYDRPVREPDERGYDYLATTPHLDICILEFEKILEAVIGLAAYEAKLKRLGDEILKTTRRLRVIEDRILPRLHLQIRAVTQHISEREREAYCRLKRYRQQKNRTIRKRQQ